VEAGEDSPQRGRLVEVRLPKKVLGPVEVRLSCRRQLETNNSPNAADWLDLSGFEVLGAARQWGTLAAATTADRQILWGAIRGARQIDQLPESLRVQGLAGGFEYFAQPFSLQVRLNPRLTRINVEPEYLIFVDREADLHHSRREGRRAEDFHARLGTGPRGAGKSHRGRRRPER
jgi:hypothetical protein